MSRYSARDPMWKSSSRTRGACTRSPALQHQASPDDVSMQRTGVGLFVGRPKYEHADKPRSGLSRNSIPEGEHFVSCDNDVDICGYFMNSSIPRIGASIINLQKAADRRFRAYQAQKDVGTEYICGGSHGEQTFDPTHVPKIALSLGF